MSAFFHWFVIVITVASMIGALWLLFANARGKPGESEDTGHVWDNDLREYNNPLPRWWLNLFVITVVFGAGYLVFYPGLGNFAGTSGWTQQKQMNERLELVKAKRQAVYAAFKDKDVAALAQDPAALALGRGVFLNNCAGCHGADAHGAIGFPNLADHDTLFGISPEAILTSITSGRGAQMPAFNAVLSAEAVQTLVDFVPRWSDPTLDAAKREAGLKQFSVTCTACHGADGKGNIALGAPNLTDDIWFFGGSPEQVRHTILFGRSTQMPAHGDILSPDDIRVVAAYVYGLTQSAAATP
ncbi:MAG: cytochrome-c oxidase, cbb3-type subunit III [Hydrocarboniphaga effusa]|nr:cytochrome-c oxidase, cbb3-type subunit III [Hydrocarboniphaga effusa]